MAAKIPVKTPLMFHGPPKTLAAFGERIRPARRRRRFTMDVVATRSDISRPTLTKIENGDTGVAIGHYFKVLGVLGLDKEFQKVAQDDVVGRRPQNLGLPQFARRPRRKNSPPHAHTEPSA
jgi:transcriptional regulator with XRE-family HTH domain